MVDVDQVNRNHAGVGRHVPSISALDTEHLDLRTCRESYMRNVSAALQFLRWQILKISLDVEDNFRDTLVPPAMFCTAH